MKSDRLKKIIIILIIIAIIVGVVLLFKKGGSNVSEKEEKAITETTDIVYNIFEGHGTFYGGQDLLFEKDSIKYEDLSVGEILHTAELYIISNNMNHSVDKSITNDIEKKYNYSFSEYTPFSGEAMRKAIKEFFGKDFKNESTEYKTNYVYEYIYIKDYDVYLKKYNEELDSRDTNYSIQTKTIDTKKNNDTIEKEIVVAYVYNTGEKYAYSKYSSIKEAVIELPKLEEIPEDKYDKFDHYIITLKKSGDNYAFESITKKK